MNHTFLRLAPALALGLPLLAFAQARAPEAKPQPLRYDSAYADYKPYRDLETGDWRALNSTVGVAGMKHGGMGHTMPSATAATPAAPASAPKGEPTPHQHHKHHQMGGTK